MPGPPRKRQRREEKQAAGEMPRKKLYRQRAHANPFSDHRLEYPASPDAMDWSSYYPAYVIPEDDDDLKTGVEHETTTTTTTETQQTQIPRLSRRVEVADIGCGFGGLLFALAPLMPDTLLLGLEIRVSVSAFVQGKIHASRALRQQAPDPEAKNAQATKSPPSPTAAARAAPAASTLGPDQTDKPTLSANQDQDPTAHPEPPSPHSYDNIACLRANAMKFLPNFFHRGQLKAIFLCFPDPHFKARKHKARIVNAGLAAEYAYVLRPGGKIYTITDVEDLHLWMTRHFDAHPSFDRVEEREVEGDQCVRVMRSETEEGKKVERNGGTKFVAVFTRTEDPPWSVS